MNIDKVKEFIRQRELDKKAEHNFNEIVNLKARERNVKPLRIKGTRWYHNNKEMTLDTTKILHTNSSGFQGKRINWDLFYNVRNKRDYGDKNKAAHKVIFLSLSNGEAFGNPYSPKDERLNMRFHAFQAGLEEIKADIYATSMSKHKKLGEEYINNPYNYYALLEVLLNKDEFKAVNNMHELGERLFEMQEFNTRLTEPEDVYEFIRCRNKYAKESFVYDIMGEDFNKFKNTEKNKKLIR